MYVYTVSPATFFRFIISYVHRFSQVRISISNRAKKRLTSGDE